MFKKKANGTFSFGDTEDIINTTTTPRSDKKDFAAPSHVLTPDEILNQARNTSDNLDNGNAMNALKKRMGIPVESEMPAISKAKTTNPPAKSENSNQSLLEKLKPYTVDENGQDLAVDSAPIYELKSVAEILKNDQDKLLESLAKKYGISVKDLQNAQAASNEKARKPDIAPQKNQEKTTSPDKKTAQNEDFYAEPNRTKRADDYIKQITASLDGNADTEADKNTANAPTKTALPRISDIDNDVLNPSSEEKSKSTADGSTIIFKPVEGKDGKEKQISISSTHSFDIAGIISDEETGEFESATELEQSDFEDFVPDGEFTKTNGKAIYKSLALKRRNSLLQMLVSGLVLALLCLFFIPPLGDMLIKSTRTCMSVCTVLFALSFAANLDAVMSIKTALYKKCDSDLPALLVMISTLAVSIAAIFMDKNAFDIILLGSVTVFTRALTKFWQCAANFGNLRQIAIKRPKKAITLLSDTATTLAMAKNAIEGDVLIAASKPAEFVDDFMKYTTYGTKLSGKLMPLTAVSFFIAVLSGVAVGTEHGMISGMGFATSVLCIAAMPILFFIDALPIFSSAKHLNKKGAMIAGITGAEALENANAAVISSADIFPSGTIIYRDIRVLSENNVDDTVMKAASLTEAINSPLAPLFQKIAGTGSGYSIPPSDSVKYEDRMGISGWVDGEMLFIGNRTLLTAHGIKLPDIEVDKSILKDGCFPIFLATDKKACAVVSVEYTASDTVVRELSNITELGITLLVDNCDPNINEEMLCDYLGLREGFIKIMSKTAVHLYKNAARPAESVSAPASYRTGGLTFISVLNSASAMKRSNILLTVCYIIAAIVGVTLFLYYSFTGGDLINAQWVLLYELGATALTTLLYLLKKP